LHQSASEVRSVRPLTGSCEEDLPDHSEDVVLVGIERRAAPGIESKWKANIHLKENS
jgi:hypothetical protein